MAEPLPSISICVHHGDANRRLPDFDVDFLITRETDNVPKPKFTVDELVNGFGKVSDWLGEDGRPAARPDIVQGQGVAQLRSVRVRITAGVRWCEFELPAERVDESVVKTAVELFNTERPA